MQKPSLPRGTRDFGPEKMVRRQYILDNIRTVFQRFGFQPLQTPAIENLSVLMGKYGEEGDQLLFKILNQGDFLKNITPENIVEGSKKNILKFAERGLRYDLTVPFARFVAMNHQKLAMPFRRYQIQPVWRGDNPQKGRYREFYQCDADVVGTDSLLCEAEIVLMVHQVFQQIGIQNFTLKINNRKILTGIAEYIGATGQEATLCVAIDKLDKIGEERVVIELREHGFSDESLQKLQPIFRFTGNNKERFSFLKNWLKDVEIAQKGIKELESIWEMVREMGISDDKIAFDITLARGLSYYTGAIFEVKANDVQMGSISGGGRYDNLTEGFGLKGISGVGISFGVDRIYDVMEELNLFPSHNTASTQLLFCNFDTQATDYTLPLLAQARAAGINTEMYPTTTKLKKQLDYADKKQIPFVVLIGSQEMQSGKLTLKNMLSGEQQSLTVNEIMEQLLNHTA